MLYSCVECHENFHLGFSWGAVHLVEVWQACVVYVGGLESAKDLQQQQSGLGLVLYRATRGYI